MFYEKICPGPPERERRPGPTPGTRPSALGKDASLRHHARRRAVTTRLPCSSGKAMREANPSRRAWSHRAGTSPRPLTHKYRLVLSFYTAGLTQPFRCCRPRGRLCDELCGPKHSPHPCTPSATPGSPTCGRDFNPACPGKATYLSRVGRQRPGHHRPCPSVIPQKAGARVKGGVPPGFTTGFKSSRCIALCRAWSSYLHCLCLYLLLSFSLSAPKNPLGANHAVCCRTCCLFLLKSPFISQTTACLQTPHQPLQTFSSMVTFHGGAVVSVLITSATLFVTSRPKKEAPPVCGRRGKILQSRAESQ